MKLLSPEVEAQLNKEIINIVQIAFDKFLEMRIRDQPDLLSKSDISKVLGITKPEFTYLAKEFDIPTFPVSESKEMYLYSQVILILSNTDRFSGTHEEKLHPLLTS